MTAPFLFSLVFLNLLFSVYLFAPEGASQVQSPCHSFLYFYVGNEPTKDIFYISISSKHGLIILTLVLSFPNMSNVYLDEIMEYALAFIFFLKVS